MSKREQEITCIVCPQGCVINVSGSGNDLKVEGHTCQRGYDYAVKEFTNPVKVEGGSLSLVSVKTEKPIPKKRIMELMQEIKKAKVDAPVEVGDVIIDDLGGTKVKLIATKKVGKKK